MYPSRKKFQVNDLPSDPQLWAIGVIVVRWSAIETLTGAFINGLTDDGTRERTTFQTTWSWSLRLEQLVDLTTQRILNPWRADILRILGEAQSIQDLRDKIVHGQWGGPQNKDFIGPDAHVFNMSKPHASFSWKATFGDLMAIAYRIDRLQASIMDFYFANKDGAPGIKTLGDALRHRRRTEGPAS